MAMRVISLAVLAVLSLAGCVSGNGFDDIVNTWTGHHVDGVIHNLGTPHRVTNLQGGGTVVSYSYDSLADTVVLPSGNSYAALPRNCTTDFFTDGGGTIRAIRFSGPGCDSHNRALQLSSL